MHPEDCPAWEYDRHPHRHEILFRKTKELLLGFEARRIDAFQHAPDTRGIHQHLFQELTPFGCDYYAGHYRGEQFRCLIECPVMVGADPRVGANPSEVAPKMTAWSGTVRAAIEALDAVSPKTEAAQFLMGLVAIVTSIYVHLLTIHPYVNGNGHAARFVLWAICLRFGFYPERFPIEPSPPDRSYSTMISTYRDGNPAPLESFVLALLI